MYNRERGQFCQITPTGDGNFGIAKNWVGFLYERGEVEVELYWRFLIVPRFVQISVLVLLVLFVLLCTRYSDDIVFAYLTNKKIFGNTSNCKSTTKPSMGFHKICHLAMMIETCMSCGTYSTHSYFFCMYVNLLLSMYYYIHQMYPCFNDNLQTSASVPPFLFPSFH